MIQDNTNYINMNNFVGSNAEIDNTIDKFDFNSFYRAYVVDNQDFQKLGRVKIRIPALHEHSTTYPWAYPATLTGFGFQTGMFITPPVGSLVWVTFEYSDEHRPIYFGGIPTTYAEGKLQSYGPSIYNGDSIPVSTDDIPVEFTGTQQIIYKSPRGSILYFDSSDLKDLIALKNTFGAGLEVASIYNSEEETYDRYTKLIHDKDNYIKIQDGEFHLVLNGEDIVFEPSTFNSYNQLTNKPQINNVTLQGNKTSNELGLQDKLVSGTNIKTINNESLLGNGNIEIIGNESYFILSTSEHPNNTLSLMGLKKGIYLWDDGYSVFNLKLTNSNTEKLTYNTVDRLIYVLRDIDATLPNSTPIVAIPAFRLNDNTIKSLVLTVNTNQASGLLGSGDLELHYINSISNQTVNGVKTFLNLPVSNNTPTSGTQLVNKNYADSVADKTFLFTQSTASDTWVIHHNLNKYPAVVVMDSSGNVVTGDITYDDENQVTITFKGGFKGKATLN